MKRIKAILRAIGSFFKKLWDKTFGKDKDNHDDIYPIW